MNEIVRKIRKKQEELTTMINTAFDSSYQNDTGTPLMPFAECGAMSQGYIGYHLQQTITDELNKRKIHYLIVNASECESYTSCDSALMYHNSEEILEAIDAMHKEAYHVVQGMCGIHPGDPTYNTDQTIENYKSTM